jgi:hypothetical protein
MQRFDDWIARNAHVLIEQYGTISAILPGRRIADKQFVLCIYLIVDDLGLDGKPKFELKAHDALPIVTLHGWYLPTMTTRDYFGPDTEESLQDMLPMGCGISIKGEANANATLGAYVRNNSGQLGLLTVAHLVRHIALGTSVTIEHRRHYGDYMQATTSGGSLNQQQQEQFMRDALAVCDFTKTATNCYLGNFDTSRTKDGSPMSVGVDAVFIELPESYPQGTPRFPVHGSWSPPRLEGWYGSMGKITTTNPDARKIGKFGLNTGLTRTRIKSLMHRGTVVLHRRVPMWSLESVTVDANVELHNMIIAPSSDMMFCASGDSGALVWCENERATTPAQAYAIGLVSGVIAGQTVISPLPAIMEALQLETLIVAASEEDAFSE